MNFCLNKYFLLIPLFIFPDHNSNSKLYNFKETHASCLVKTLNITNGYLFFVSDLDVNGNILLFNYGKYTPCKRKKISSAVKSNFREELYLTIFSHQFLQETSKSYFFDKSNHCCFLI